MQVWEHCFHNVPEIQEQLMTVLCMISKKAVALMLPSVEEILNALHKLTRELL
jgi:hypothetical protein